MGVIVQVRKVQDSPGQESAYFLKKVDNTGVFKKCFKNRKQKKKKDARKQLCHCYVV